MWYNEQYRYYHYHNIRSRLMTKPSIASYKHANSWWQPINLNSHSNYFIICVPSETALYIVHNNMFTLIPTVIISFVVFPRKWLYNLPKYGILLFDPRHLSHCRAKRSAIWPFTARFIFLGSQSRSLWCPFQYLDKRCTCAFLLSWIHWEWWHIMPWLCFLTMILLLAYIEQGCNVAR